MSNRAPDIKQAQLSDFQEICNIDPIALRDDKRKVLLKQSINGEHCYIAVSDNNILGFIIFTQTFFDQAFIELLVVKENQRRSGVGTALIQHIEAICPTDKLFTSTNQSNSKMHSLCIKQGFQRSGIIENLEEGDPEIIYFKRITKR